MLEFLKTYWYFIVAALLVVVVIVFWAIEIHNSKKNKSGIEKLELEDKELDEMLNKNLKEEKESSVEESTQEKTENQNKPKLGKNQKEHQEENQTSSKTSENKEETQSNNSEKLKSSTAKVKYSVTYDKDKKDWVVKKAGSERATKRCKTKKEAMETIEKLSSHNQINLSVKKKDGKFQKLDNAKKSTSKKS